MEKRIWVWDTGCLRFRVASGTICVCVCVPIAMCLDYIQQVKGKLLTLRQVSILKYEGQEKKRNILLMFDNVNIIPPSVNCLPCILIFLQHNKNSERYEICFRLNLLQAALGENSQLCPCMLSFARLLVLALWFSAQKFTGERRTAEEADTDRADLVTLSLGFPAFAVNISFTMT